MNITKEKVEEALVILCYTFGGYFILSKVFGC